MRLTLNTITKRMLFMSPKRKKAMPVLNPRDQMTSRIRPRYACQVDSGKGIWRASPGVDGREISPDRLRGGVLIMACPHPPGRGENVGQ